MVDGLQRWAEGNAKPLAIVLHGWCGSPCGMKDVTDATKAAFQSCGGVDVYVPLLQHSRVLCAVRTQTELLELLDKIDNVIGSRRSPYERIVLIGHSLGAVLVRRLFLLAAGDPPGFRARLHSKRPARAHGRRRSSVW